MKKNNFQIQLYDKKGNKITEGGDEVDVEIDGPEGSIVKVKDTGTGLYNIQVIPTKLGKYKVRPIVLREEIKDSPIDTKTDGPMLPSSKRSQIVNWGLKIHAPTKNENDFEISIKTKKI